MNTEFESRRPHHSYSVWKAEFSIPDIPGSRNPFDLMTGRETCWNRQWHRNGTCKMK